MAGVQDNEFVRITAAAELLGIKTRAVLTLIDEGKLPAFKHEGRLAVRLSDVERRRGRDPG